MTQNIGLDPVLMFMIEACALWGAVRRLDRKITKTIHYNQQISKFTKIKLRYAVYIIKKKKPRRAIADEIRRAYIYRLEAIELYEQLEVGLQNIENILNADEEIFKITKVRILQLGKKILRDFRPDFSYKWRME